jgi:hypothetical protein
MQEVAHKSLLSWLPMASGLLRKVSRRGRVLRAFLSAAILVNLSAAGQMATQSPSLKEAKAVSSTPDIPLCSGAASGSSPGNAPSHVNPHSHSVTLSWNAPVSASRSPADAIKGYQVYRSVKSQTYAESDRISQSPVHGTRCVDMTVEARNTYFYVVRAVTEDGMQSGSSNEIKAVVPFP